MKNIDVNKSDKNGVTPLYIASANGRKDIVELLLNMKNIDVNKSEKNGGTPLLIASEDGRQRYS